MACVTFFYISCYGRLATNQHDDVAMPSNNADSAVVLSDSNHSAIRHAKSVVQTLFIMFTRPPCDRGSEDRHLLGYDLLRLLLTLELTEDARSTFTSPTSPPRLGNKSSVSLSLVCFSYPPCCLSSSFMSSGAHLQIVSWFFVLCWTRFPFAHLCNGPAGGHSRF